MKKHSIAFLLFICLFTISCQINEKQVKIITSKGNMTVKLYNETPKHRDNFIKLSKDKFFDGILFHRVIKEFMIQGGDPESIGATSQERLGNGGPGYQIDAEIVPELFHKKGALSAARQGDRSNPERRSSGSQFYIVQGKVFSGIELDELEEKKHNEEVRKVIKQLMSAKRDTLTILQKENDMEGFTTLRLQIEEEAELIASKNRFKYSEEARKVYATIGGTPHLDGAYTVFGEVTEGFDVVDSIATVETNRYDRPLEDISMKIEVMK